jgi:fatty acid desaturase
MEEYVSEKLVNSQGWKFYFIAFVWPLYLISLPVIFTKLGWWSVIYMIFPGIYLFTWLGYLMHETWHKYVPGIPNDRLYFVLSWMLLTDPQIYRILHGFHHSQVNTWDDTEFHPFGEIKNRFLKIIYNFFEISIGIAFISVASTIVLPFHPRYRAKYRILSSVAAVLIILLFLGLSGCVSHFVFGAGLGSIVASFLASIWLNSFFLHHSQMIEHGNLIVEGDYNVRNIGTRNLSDRGMLEKLFLFFTHGDTREHVLHHTLVGVYSRPFPGKVPMPEESVYIDIKGYLGVLGDMLSGVTPVIKSIKK